jgi:hypothetical protein
MTKARAGCDLCCVITDAWANTYVPQDTTVYTVGIDNISAAVSILKRRHYNMGRI